MEIEVEVDALPRYFLELRIRIERDGAIEHAPGRNLLTHVGDQDEARFPGVFDDAEGPLLHDGVLIAFFEAHIGAELNPDRRTLGFENARIDLELRNGPYSVFELGRNGVDGMHDRTVHARLVAARCIDGLDCDDCRIVRDIDKGDPRGDVAVPRRGLVVPVHRKVRHDRHDDDERAGEALKFGLGEEGLPKLVLLRQNKIGLLRLAQCVDELLQAIGRQALRRAEHREAADIGKYFLNLQVDSAQGLKGDEPPIIAEGENRDILFGAHNRLCACPKKTGQ